MRVVCKQQDTAEWLQARTGICTASRMADAMGKLSRASKNGIKGDWNAAHWGYVRELAWEVITRVPSDHYVSKPMDIGKAFEGKARRAYGLAMGCLVEQTGFILHPTLNYLGSSPDGLVEMDGGVEMKVPLFHTHTAYLEADQIPDDYQVQMQTNMLCCERQWWDFVSYCPPEIAPELPEEFRLFHKRLDFDPEFRLTPEGPTIEEAATVTMEHVVQRVNELRERFPHIEAPPADFNDYTGPAWAFLDVTEMTP